MYANQGLAHNRLGYSLRKRLAIDRQRVSGRHSAFPRQIQQQRTSSVQFFFEQPRSGVWRLGLQRIRTNELREICGLMRRCAVQRPHFVEFNRHPASGAPPRRLRTCQAGADDLDRERRHGAPSLSGVANQDDTIYYTDADLRRSDMARIQLVQAENASPEVKQIYDQTLRGQVGNVHKAMAQQPEVLKNFISFYGSVGRSLEKRLYEMVYIRVSMLNQCNY
jgi:hypothetical protein